MAQPKTTSFSKFLIEFGDGAATEAFQAICGPNQRGFTIKAAVSTTTVPDCDDPEAPAWEEGGVTSLSADFNSSGVLALASLSSVRTWMLSGLAENVRIHVNETAANGGGYYSFSALLTNMGHTTSLASDAGKVQLALTGQSSGAVTWTPAAA